MIKLTATSLIHSISPVIQVSEKFAKRELILNDSWERNGEVHPNFVLIEFTGDSINILDNFAPGQRVTVEAYVNGREYTDKNGQIKWFNTIKGASIVPYQQQSGFAQPQAPAYQQPSYPQATHMPGGYPQQSAFPQQQGYSQGYATAPTYPQNPYGQQPGVADLPFPR